ncbi:MAG: hypothetical protein MUF42_11245 [Cytophagaceae bacterium]|jgi:hypothetical protein|nr:hypothetical protein [Cytophagaceae bacterium]
MIKKLFFAYLITFLLFIGCNKAGSVETVNGAIYLKGGLPISGYTLSNVCLGNICSSCGVGDMYFCVLDLLDTIPALTASLSLKNQGVFAQIDSSWQDYNNHESIFIDSLMIQLSDMNMTNLSYWVYAKNLETSMLFYDLRRYQSVAPDLRKSILDSFLVDYPFGLNDFSSKSKFNIVTTDFETMLNREIDRYTSNISSFNFLLKCFQENQTLWKKYYEKEIVKNVGECDIKLLSNILYFQRWKTICSYSFISKNSKFNVVDSALLNKLKKNMQSKNVDFDLGTLIIDRYDLDSDLKYEYFLKPRFALTPYCNNGYCNVWLFSSNMELMSTFNVSSGKVKVSNERKSSNWNDIYYDSSGYFILKYNGVEYVKNPLKFTDTISINSSTYELFQEY